MTKLSLEEVRTALELYVALRRAGLEQSAIDEFINNDEYAEYLVAALDPAPVTRAGFPFVDQPIDKLGFAPQLQIKLEREGVGSIGVLALHPTRTAPDAQHRHGFHRCDQASTESRQPPATT